MRTRNGALGIVTLLGLVACGGVSDLGTLDLSGTPKSISPGSLSGTYTVPLTRGAGSPPLVCAGVTLQVSLGTGSWSGCTSGGTPGAVSISGGTMTLSWATGSPAIVFTNFTRDNFTTRALFEGPRTAAGAGPPGRGSATFMPKRQYPTGG